MSKYKLIKKLPFEGSPEIGYISSPVLSQKDNAHYWNHNWFHPEEYPEYWEDMELKTTDSVSDKIKKVTSSLKGLLLEKNRRYGNSALEPLEGITYTAVDGIKIRLVDKIKRIINSKELRKNDIADVMGYLILLCIAYDWIDFKELLD